MGIDLARRELPPPRAFERGFRRTARPALFRLDAPELLERWSPEALSLRYGTLPIWVQRSESLTGDEHGIIEETYAPTTMEAFVAELREDQAHAGYLSQYRLFEQVPELSDGLVLRRYSGCAHRTNFWMGPPGTTSKLHYDLDENLFWQVHGRKRVYLAPPEAYPDLYATNRSWGDGYSPVDPASPDLDRHPRAAHVDWYDLVLEPGDLLYLPPRWWHDVRALDVSVSISHIWWPPRLLASTQLTRAQEWVRARITGQPAMRYGPPVEGRTWRWPTI